MNTATQASGAGGRVALGVLDLVPLSSGGDSAATIAATRTLVQKAEEAGYHRYLFAEHHFSPGLLGASPAVLVAVAAGWTSHIVVGAGAVQLGANSVEELVAEEFALLAAAFPGRVELGLGRSALSGSRPVGVPTVHEEQVTPEGLLVPRPFDFGMVVAKPRFQAVARLLGAGTGTKEFADQVENILALYAAATSGEPAGVRLPTIDHGAVPPSLRLYGSNTSTAELAGRLGLPFAANYHSLPSGVITASQTYLRAFRPSVHLREPHLVVSADVVVAPRRQQARELASGYPAWVRSIRHAEGVIPYPDPVAADQLALSDDDRELVDDRVRTQFVGSPADVAAQLDILQRATQADELLLTTITHDPDARVRSLELIAREWLGR